VSEAALQSQLIDVARLLGWKVAHFRPARTARGWRTPVAADGAGFPDLLLLRDRLVVAELKAERGRLSPAQQEWLDAFQAANIEAHTWRPADFDAAAAVLLRREVEVS
jgi:hypothetical protein